MNGRDDEDLARSRAEFAANVERRLAPRQGDTEPKGDAPKGGEAVLLTTGLLGTAMLALLVAFLGGGLLYIPALIPLVTVCSVLASRKAK